MIFGIGAQKAGTTWLYEYFKRHPDVYVSPIKEIHFFDSVYRKDFFGYIDYEKLNSLRQFINKVNHDSLFHNDKLKERLSALSDWVLIHNSQNKYENFFKQRLSGEKYSCDITPSYSMLNFLGFKAIKNTANEVKIIFIISNPVDCFWSALKMADRTGYAKKDTDFSSALSCLGYILRGDYMRTYQEIVNIFNSDEIILLFYEDLHKESSIKKLCRFLDISEEIYNISYVNADMKREPLNLIRREQAYHSFRDTSEILIFGLRKNLMLFQVHG